MGGGGVWDQNTEKLTPMLASCFAYLHFCCFSYVYLSNVIVKGQVVALNCVIQQHNLTTTNQIHMFLHLFHHKNNENLSGSPTLIFESFKKKIYQSTQQYSCVMT